MFSKLTKKAKAGLVLGILAIGTTGLLLGGQGMTLARAIRGWDYPWDPPNYYSPTSISWADTNNPSFFYRDLGWQGGNVYDLTREIKSKLFEGNFESILATVMDKFLLQEKDHHPLDESMRNEVLTLVDKKQESTTNAYAELMRASLDTTGLFHSQNETPASYDAPRDKARQRLVISNAATAYAAIAESGIAQTDEMIQTVLKLLEAAQHAEGKRELQEIQDQLQAIIASNKQLQAVLMAGQTQLEADQGRIEYDENVEWQKEVDKAMMMVYDPYDKQRQKEYRESGKEKSAPRGFVPFE